MIWKSAEFRCVIRFGNEHIESEWYDVEMKEAEIWCVYQISNGTHWRANKLIWIGEHDKWGRVEQDMIIIESIWWGYESTGLDTIRNRLDSIRVEKSWRGSIGQKTEARRNGYEPIGLIRMNKNGYGLSWHEKIRNGPE